MKQKISQKLSKEKVIECLEKHRNEIHKFSVRKIGLFGSFLEGKQKKDSDIDFIVEFDEQTFDNYMDLKFFLEDLFGRKVDLVIEGNLKPALKYVKEDAVYAAGV